MEYADYLSFDKTPRVVTWEDIKLINKMAKKRGYNRLLDIAKLKKAIQKNWKDEMEKIKFPATPLLIHEHKAGEPCEKHMRISIYFPKDNRAILDCELYLWNSFERAIRR